MRNMLANMKERYWVLNAIDIQNSWRNMYVCHFIGFD